MLELQEGLFHEIGAVVSAQGKHLEYA
jgi:hypothetical protein